MADIKELIVVSVTKEKSKKSGAQVYDLVTLKQVAGLSVTGSIKYRMEKGQPLLAKRVSNNDRIAVGDVMDGFISKQPTTPYNIGENGRLAESFTVAVFDGESPVDLVNDAFARQNILACATVNGIATLDLTVSQPAVIVDEAQ